MNTAALVIPPSPGYVRTARLLAASIARQAGLCEDDVDDVRMAVTEACLLRLGLEESISLKFDVDATALRIMVGPYAPPAVSEPENQLAMTVLRGVTPELQLTDDGLVLVWPTTPA